MTADALPLPLPTAPGCMLGVIAVDGNRATVQCSRCYAIKTDTTLKYDSRGNWIDGERLCRDCRKACGCAGCKRSPWFAAVIVWGLWT